MSTPEFRVDSFGDIYYGGRRVGAVEHGTPVTWLREALAPQEAAPAADQGPSISEAIAHVEAGGTLEQSSAWLGQWRQWRPWRVTAAGLKEYPNQDMRRPGLRLVPLPEAPPRTCQ